MKGLLIKDFSLMKVQKNFFIIILGISVFMAVFLKELSFPMGFLPMVISMFTLSTISYDEFDNGNSFLFTLPITREIYVLEKYCLGIILGCTAWGISLFLGSIAILIGATDSFEALWPIALTIFPLMLLLMALLIPLQFKFGSEKEKIAMVAVFGILTLVGILLTRVGKHLGITPEDFLNTISRINPVLLGAGSILLAILLFGISAKISIKIMKEKEF